jgi:hypothetical protein
MNWFADQFDKGFEAWRDPSWWYMLATLPWLLGAVLFIHEALVDRSVSKRERTAVGTITAHEPESHNQYRYTFVVNDMSYVGLGHPAKEPAQIGEQVLVYYDSDGPQNNALEGFADLSTDALVPVPAMMFVIGAIATSIWWQRRKKSIARS